MPSQELISIDSSGEYSIVSVPSKYGPRYCKIDHEDVSLIRSCEWIGFREQNVPKWRIYFIGKLGGRQIQLHRLITGSGPFVADGTVVDHIDGDGGNCRRLNLRKISHHISTLNRPSRSNGKSGIRGVRRRKAKWAAMICEKYIGLYADIRDAAEAVWLALLSIDPVSAENYLRSLPETYDAAKYCMPRLIKRTNRRASHAE